MISKIKTLILSTTALFIFAAPAMIPAAVLADNPVSPQNQVCTGANTLQIPDNANNQAADQNQCTNTATGGTSKVNSLIRTILNVLSVIVGVIAVVMIIIGGFRYVTSGGQSEKVTSAKNTLLYAIIGLVIVALAQVIVKFILDKAING